MVIALLIVLGVNLIVIVAFVTVVIKRRRWLNRQPGAFPGAIRTTNGDLDGIPSEWKHGTSRYVRDVLVWSKAPFMFRNQLVPIDRAAGERTAKVGELKRLGDRPSVIQLTAGEVSIEIAGSADHRALIAGPFARSVTDQE